MATRTPRPPEQIDGLRLFEKPMDGEQGRVVYQGRERPGVGRFGGHDYWIVEQDAPGEWNLVRAVATFDRDRHEYDREDEKVLGTFPTNIEAVDAIERHTNGGSGAAPSIPRAETETVALWDGTIRFLPPFTKEGAVYRPTSDPDFQASHDRCMDCVHYIEGGGCHFVQGEIDPAAYCEEYYADYGAFAHDHDDYVEVNAELVGDKWHPSQADIVDLVDEIEERAQQRLREHRGG